MGKLSGNNIEIDFVANAASLGAYAVRVKTSEELEQALIEARKQPRTSVVRWLRLTTTNESVAMNRGGMFHRRGFGSRVSPHQATVIIPKRRKRRDIFCSIASRSRSGGSLMQVSLMQVAGSDLSSPDPGFVCENQKANTSEVSRLREVHSLRPSLSRRHFLKASALLGLEGAAVSSALPLLGSVSSAQPDHRTHSLFFTLVPPPPSGITWKHANGTLAELTTSLKPQAPAVLSSITTMTVGWIFIW